MSPRAFGFGGRILWLSAALAAFSASAARAQDMLPPPGFGQSQGQDPYAALRLKECRDLGSFAVVDAPGDRSGAIKANPGSPCADLLSLQPVWMPYIQLNVDVGRGSGGNGQDGLGQGGSDQVPWPPGWGPSRLPGDRRSWNERKQPAGPSIDVSPGSSVGVR